MRRDSRWCGSLAIFLVGCTSNGYAPLNNAASLGSTDGVILLDDDEGDTLPVTPDSRVSFETEHGWTAPVDAGQLCRTPVHLAVRVGDTCEGATPLVPYSEIKGVEVDTLDRAGTVAIVSAVSAVVLGVLAIVLGAAKSKSGGSSSGNGTGKAASALLPSRGGGRGQYGGRYDGTGLYGVNVFVNAVGGPAGPNEEPPVTLGVPLRKEGVGRSFTPYEARRSELSVLASADVTASAFTRDGVSSGVHGGIRVNDFVDVAIGARFLEGGSSLDSARAVPTAKIGLHGEFPRARWIALGLSFEGGAGTAVNLYLDARFGLRFEPFRGFWIGVYPIHPSYVDWAHGRGEHWVPQSSADIVFGF